MTGVKEMAELIALRRIEKKQLFVGICLLIGIVFCGGLAAACVWLLRAGVTIDSRQTMLLSAQLGVVLCVVLCLGFFPLMMWFRDRKSDVWAGVIGCVLCGMVLTSGGMVAVLLHNVYDIEHPGPVITTVTQTTTTTSSRP